MLFSKRHTVFSDEANRASSLAKLASSVLRRKEDGENPVTERAKTVAQVSARQTHWQGQIQRCTDNCLGKSKPEDAKRRRVEKDEEKIVPGKWCWTHERIVDSTSVCDITAKMNALVRRGVLLLFA